MSRVRDPRRGAGIALTLFGALALMGVGALAIDFSRAYVARNELQTAADAMAVAAARHLDGTRAGSYAAREAALRIENGWHFGTEALLEPLVEFSPNGGANTWRGVARTNDRYVRVRVEAELTMSLGQMFASESLTPAGALPIGALAVAMRAGAKPSELPVLPILTQGPSGAWRDGMAVMVAPGESGRGSCGDGFGPASLFEPDPRGLPGSFEALAVREWALREGVEAPRGTPSPTDWMEDVPERMTLRMIAGRDTDRTSGLFADYARLGRGNAQRLVRVMALREGSAASPVNVLLPPLAAMTEGPICGEYVSEARLGGSPWPVARSAGHSVRLVAAD